MISIPASIGFFNPKNKKDHNELKANWITKKIRAAFTSSCFDSISFQTKAAAQPIIINSKLQTGAKIQFGGLKLGFISDGYHVSILDLVTIPDK